MRRILCSDWVPERARWSNTACPGLCFVPANKISSKFIRVHESFISPKLFSAEVKRFFVISVFMEPENGKTESVNEIENKENKNVDEF